MASPDTLQAVKDWAPPKSAVFDRTGRLPGRTETRLATQAIGHRLESIGFAGVPRLSSQRVPDLAP